MWSNQNGTSKWAIAGDWLSNPNKCNWHSISCEPTTGTIDGDNGSSETSIILNSTESYVGVLPTDAILLQRHESATGLFGQKQLQRKDPLDAPTVFVLIR
jgi:hypothetical protein